MKVKLYGNVVEMSAKEMGDFLIAMAKVIDKKDWSAWLEQNFQVIM